MRVTVGTVLEAPAEWVWAQLHNPETFDYITGWMLAVEPLDFDPATVDLLAHEGLHLRVRIMHLLPGFDYEIRIAHLDEKGMVAVTHEHGGLLRRWHHRIAVRPLDAGSCRYQDQVDLDAGPMTPVVWAYAHAFYRYRQRRWRELARRAGVVTPGA